MTEQEARILIYNAVYRVIRVAKPLAFDVFFKTTIRDTLPLGLTSAPTYNYWMEAIAVEIQGSIIAQNEYILSFNGDWLKANIDKKWEALMVHMETNLVPST